MIDVNAFLCDDVSFYINCFQVLYLDFDNVIYSRYIFSLSLCFQDLGVLVHENVGKRVMIVTPSGHDDVKRFWRRYRQGQQSGNR